MGFFKDFYKNNDRKKADSESETESQEELLEEQILNEEVPDTNSEVVEEFQKTDTLESEELVEEVQEDRSEEEIYQEILNATEELLNSEAALFGEEPVSVHTENEIEQPQRNEQDDLMDEIEEEIKELKETGNGENTMVDFEESVVDEELLDTLLNEEEKTPNPKQENIVPKRETSPEDKEAVTVITKGTTINGSITSDCSLKVMGTVIGDIECQGKLSISGRITGNSIASEIEINSKRLEGSVNSEGNIKVEPGTVIIGDITATSGQIAGAVKGEVDINGPVVLDTTAIVKGNVKAKSVQMNNGAVLEGFCSLAYASVDIDDVFEEK